MYIVQYLELNVHNYFTDWWGNCNFRHSGLAVALTPHKWWGALESNQLSNFCGNQSKINRLFVTCSTTELRKQGAPGGIRTTRPRLYKSENYAEDSLKTTGSLWLFPQKSALRQVCWTEPKTHLDSEHFCSGVVSPLLPDFFWSPLPRSMALCYLKLYGTT